MHFTHPRKAQKQFCYFYQLNHPDLRGGIYPGRMVQSTMIWPTLSLHQPWATAIADGHKRIETRSWWTAYRGPIAIHAAKRNDAWFERILRKDHGLLTATPELPLGAIVATATLIDCFPYVLSIMERPGETWLTRLSCSLAITHPAGSDGC